MNRHSPSTLSMLALLCLLLMRIGAPHLHLCFDGTEPPVSVHVYDGSGHHDEPALDLMHDDLDVVLGTELLTKSSPSEQDQPLVFLVAALLFAILWVLCQILVLPPRRFRVTAISHLRPLLRGPPRLISR